MYRIVGADQKEYGPITADQLRQWIGEGRANGQSLVRFEDGPWKPLSTFPEFAGETAPIGPPPLVATGALPPLPVPPPGVRRNPMAITGLIVSLFGFCCGPLLSILGLVFSCIGLTQINRNPTVESGRGLALAGILISGLSLVLWVILWITGSLAHLIQNVLHSR